MCDASQSQSGLRQVRKKSTRYLSIEDPRSLFLHTLKEQTEAYLSTEIQTKPNIMDKMKFSLTEHAAPGHMKAIIGTGQALVAMGQHDYVGIIDGYFPNAAFFNEFEGFDGHLCSEQSSITYRFVRQTPYTILLTPRTSAREQR